MTKTATHHQYKDGTFCGRISQNLTNDPALVTCAKCKSEAQAVANIDKIYADFLALQEGK